MNLEETFMHFLLQHQQRFGRTLNFLILMEAIQTAANYIQHYYYMGALQGNSGEHGAMNVQGENVMRLDDMANKIVLHYLRESHQVVEATSEEQEEQIEMDSGGRYFVYFDPLDGSSNIKHSLPVGFLFGIAKRNLEGKEDYHLRSGREFIAAGLYLIPTGTFTFALKNSGAWLFLRDESGVYVRPKKIEFPKDPKNWELSFNSANRDAYDQKIQNWIRESESKYNFRYAGSLAVDFHRLLHNGGLFMYPALLNKDDPKKNYPNGKLRLIYECAVIAFIAQQAGGLAVDQNGTDILDIIPEKRHQRSTLFVGNKELIKGMHL